MRGIFIILTGFLILKRVSCLLFFGLGVALLPLLGGGGGGGFSDSRKEKAGTGLATAACSAAWDTSSASSSTGGVVAMDRALVETVAASARGWGAEGGCWC